MRLERAGQWHVDSFTSTLWSLLTCATSQGKLLRSASDVEGKNLSTKPTSPQPTNMVNSSRQSCAETHPFDRRPVMWPRLGVAATLIFSSCRVRSTLINFLVTILHSLLLQISIRTLHLRCMALDYDYHLRRFCDDAFMRSQQCFRQPIIVITTSRSTRENQ